MKAPRPLILIVGSTGTGKSELAVALASRHNGEIINGDALQLYKGLPIVTNKLPDQQRKGVPHHLLGCVGLDEPPWTVRQFRDKARSLIRDIRQREKLPIVVGGTNYYVQSLLPSISTILEEQGPESEPKPLRTATFPILSAPTSDIFLELQRLDPTTAARTHPKDRRKVQRGLEICLENGCPASQIYQQRRERVSEVAAAVDGEEAESAIPDNFLVFWTHAAPLALNPRLDERVNRMIVEGLVDEVEDVRQYSVDCKAKGVELDPTHGIWTAIGYKEFLPLLSLPERSESIKDECIERMKIATRQYAKRQNRWIRLTLLPALSEAGYQHRIYPLDASAVARFDELVVRPALKVAAALVNDELLPKAHDVSSIANECLDIPAKPVIEAHHCDVCDKTLMTEDQWKAHLSSKGHRSASRPKRDLQALRGRVQTPT